MPYLGSTIFVATLVAATLLSLNAWWLLVRALAPRFVERSRERWQKRPIVTVLLGAVTGGFGTIAAVLLLSVGHPASSFVGASLIALLLSVSFAGTAGLAASIGGGLASPTDVGREWFQTLKGGMVLELVYLVPFVGWFVLLPLSVLGGFGAAIQSALAGLFSRAVVPVNAPSA